MFLYNKSVYLLFIINNCLLLSYIPIYVNLNIISII